MAGIEPPASLVTAKATPPHSEKVESPKKEIRQVTKRAKVQDWAKREKQLHDRAVEILTEQGRMSKTRLMHACINSGLPDNKVWMLPTLEKISKDPESPIAYEVKELHGRETHEYYLTTHHS